MQYTGGTGGGETGDGYGKEKTPESAPLTRLPTRGPL